MPKEILMPALSPTMEEGNLAKWVKKEGDKVKPGDVIAEIETDKATMEVEAVDEGTIGKIIIKEGTQNVKVNALIALLLEDGEDKKTLDSYKSVTAKVLLPSGATSDSEGEKARVENKPLAAASTSGGGFTEAPKAPVFTTQTVVTKTTSANGERVKASPLAKRLAAEKGVDVSSITGSGPYGRVVKADIENAGSGSGRVMRSAVEVTAVPNDNMRKVIAKRLLQSKQHVPHFYLTIECAIDKLLDVRKDLNESSPLQEGKPAYKISVNDMIIKAVAKALKKVPEANASWSDEAILMYSNVDVAVAVAIDGGLVTPIVRNADQKSLPAISNEMKLLADKARKGKLQPEEFQGGGFSISNLGMYGIKNFSAIINPPQSCILAVGAGEERAVVKNGKIEIANVVSFTLSCDHRVVDGAVGANFLAAFKECVERPILLVM